MAKYLNEITKFHLPPSGTILMPFDAEAAVASLPVYCSSSRQAGVIQHLLEFLEQGDYQYQFISRACPTTQQQGGSNVMLANQSFEDQISVPTGSFLTMIGGITTDPVAGFRVQFYDAGSQSSISDGWVGSDSICGRYTQLPQTGTGMLTNVAGNKGLLILPSPLAITSPGQLNVLITNLSDNTATIDMAFYFACPVGNYDMVHPSWVGNAVGR